MAYSCTKAAGQSCAVCHVGQRSVWHDLDGTLLALLERGQRRREYGSGEVVFAQGMQNDGVYCVSGGTVGIRRCDGNGNSVLLELAYPGDTIGYRSFLTDGEHKTSAEALGPTVVCHIDRATLKALLAANPALGLCFLKRSIGALENAHDTMFRHATLSNRHKLVCLLLVLVRRHGQRLANGSRSIELPVSRRDLASMVGTRHETVSRIIGRLGIADDVLPNARAAFRAAVREHAERLAADPAFEQLIADKRARRARDETAKSLETYRAEELERMRLAFYGFDPSYHAARWRFITREPIARTPLHLARHRMKSRSVTL